MKEIWKPIKNYENLYLVSNLGNIYSIRNKRNLILQLNATAHTKVVLWKNGKPYYTTAHRLVAETFIPNSENKPFVLHKVAIADGGTNCVNNLYWGTQSDNMRDRVRDGRQPYQNWNLGGKHPSCAKKFKMRLYEMAYGREITEEMAIDWVESMDPPGKWTIEQTSTVKKQYGIEDISDVDFFVVMNMMYSDYHKMLSEDVDRYVTMTKMWLNDPDAAKDKLFNYKMYVID